MREAQRGLRENLSILLGLRLGLGLNLRAGVQKGLSLGLGRIGFEVWKRIA